MQTGSRGFTYLQLLFVLALGGVGLAALGEQAQLAAQREREAEFFFRGEQMARAIASYVEASPGGSRNLPLSVDDLLEDRRSGRVVRHLRQAYRDPLQRPGDGASGWVWLRRGEGGCGNAAAGPAGVGRVALAGLVAVRSASERMLLRRGDTLKLQACDQVFSHVAYLRGAAPQGADASP